MDIRVTYDESVDVAYFYFSDPPRRSARQETVDGYDFILDFDENNYLIGMEVLWASKRLPAHILERAEILRSPSPRDAFQGDKDWPAT